MKRVEVAILLRRDYDEPAKCENATIPCEMTSSQNVCSADTMPWASTNAIAFIASYATCLTLDPAGTIIMSVCAFDFSSLPLHNSCEIRFLGALESARQPPHLSKSLEHQKAFEPDNHWWRPASPMQEPWSIIVGGDRVA